MGQRQPNDRRRLGEIRSFPFRDGNGVKVFEERRKQPDRRMNGVDEGEWIVIPGQPDSSPVAGDEH